MSFDGDTAGSIVVLQQESYLDRQIGARRGYSKNVVRNVLEKFRKYS